MPGNAATSLASEARYSIIIHEISALVLLAEEHKEMSAVEDGP